MESKLVSYASEVGLSEVKLSMKRIAVMADIHSNIYALDQALKIIDDEGVDGIFVCGDVVGYGTSPNECCELLRERDFCFAVMGNHDAAVAGVCGFSNFGSKAAYRIRTTLAVITPENKSWLQGLPMVVNEGEMSFVHSSLVEPERWSYLTIREVARESFYRNVSETFAVMEGVICFVGHTHIPVIFQEGVTGNELRLPGDEPFFLEDNRVVINVGSIGRPRNKDWQASFVIYDRISRSVEFKYFMDKS